MHCMLSLKLFLLDTHSYRRFIISPGTGHIPKEVGVWDGGDENQGLKKRLSVVQTALLYSFLLTFLSPFQIIQSVKDNNLLITHE